MQPSSGRYTFAWVYYKQHSTYAVEKEYYLLLSFIIVFVTDRVIFHQVWHKVKVEIKNDWKGNRYQRIFEIGNVYQPWKPELTGIVYN